FTPEKRSAVMALIRSTGNKDTELKLMALLREAGVRGWRRHAMIKTGAMRKPRTKTAPTLGPAGVKVRPDFVFWRKRVAVFVDGCFWHGCPRHGTQPQQNGAFWSEKILRNRARDRKVVRELRKEGWTVLRIWECALAPKRVMRTLGRIRKAVNEGE
ncbi:MAG TPA: very short patch repair endonuclease, partial [Prosthecobacter sp.]